MEGYSVTEAASVLGVPTERVWELLARGVLSGQTEGETGMRVFLQPRPAPSPSPVEPGRTASGNGDESRELSPFRELLTEFRNLTERYGQALLALGEARGEVASLRSRVDLLEARMDLRLPSGSLGAESAPPAGWAAPASWPTSARPPSAPPEQAPAPEPGESPPQPHPEPHPRTGSSLPEDGAADAYATEVGPRPMRRAASIRAPDTFAEALARAEDPSVPELLREAEAAAPEQPAPSPEEPGAEATLPRELPPADAVPVADEQVAEAEIVADEEEDAGSPAVADEQVADAAPAADEEQVAEAETVADEAREGEEASTAGVAPDGSASVEPGSGRSTGDQERSEPGPESAPLDSPALVGEALEGAEPAWQDDRYTAEVTEPDWWEAEAFPEAAAAAAQPDAAGEAEDPPTPDASDVEPMASEATAPAPAEGQPSTADVEEETLLRYGRSVVTTPDRPSEAGASDDALAALEALSRATPRADRSTTIEPAASPVRSAPERSLPPSPRPVPPTTAGRAYRRLRRIFPG
ncbi:MAG TPA: hypothetical protein VLA76_02220 [Candidatus Angelobacter sp.]|nr:hypothetical protein [Candidatus Angelobacter sp.]